MMTLALKAVVCIIAFLSASASLTMAYMWRFEEPFLSYTVPVPFILLSKTITAGQPILFEIQRCSTAKELRGYTIFRRMVSLTPGVKDIDLLPIPWFIDPGCDPNPTVTHAHVTPITARGRFYLKGFGEAPGMMKPLIVRWQTEPFDVVAP